LKLKIKCHVDLF